MCRGGDHGRRCPGHQVGSNLQRHNERRRQNRLIQRNVLAWMEDHDAPPAVIEQLRDAPPGRAKAWVEQQGLQPEEFAHTNPQPRTPTHVRPGVMVDGQLVRRPPRFPDERDQQPGQGDIPPPGPPPAIGNGTDPSGSSGSSSGGWDESRDLNSEWRTRGIDSALTVLAAQDLSVRERQLLGRVVHDGSLPEQGVNTTRRLTLEDGTVGYFKPFDGLDQEAADIYGHDQAWQPVHEVAAWRVAHRLGEPWSELVPPCVIREFDGQVGSFAEHRPGRLSRGSAVRNDVPHWRAAAFFDALTGQQDRHGANLLHDPEASEGEGRLTLIDHGFGFAREGDFQNVSVLLFTRRLRDGKALTEAEVDACHRFVDSPDGFGLQGVIEPARLEAMRVRAHQMIVSGELAPGF